MNDKSLEMRSRLLSGESCALITDAGTPAISDPGEDLVRLCAENGVAVTAIPGACAMVNALALSALSTVRFVFEGFLPVQKKPRRERLKELSAEKRTFILHEALCKAQFFCHRQEPRKGRQACFSAYAELRAK